MKNKTLLAVFLVAVSAAFLLGGYEVARSSINTLFKSVYSAKQMAFANSFLPLFLILSLLTYGASINFVGPGKTLVLSCLASAATMILGGFAFLKGWKEIVFFLFLFRKVYVVVIIEQYWSFINSILKDPDAKKLNGAICGIASIGAIAGGFLVSKIAEPLGTKMLLFVAGGSLLPTAFFAGLGYRLCKEPGPATPQPQNHFKNVLSLKLFRSSWLLKGLLLIIILTQVLSVSLELNFQELLSEAFKGLPDKETAYSGGFFSLVNTVALVLQFVAAPILLQAVPHSWIQYSIPCTHILMAFGLILHPSLTMAAAALLNFKGLDYSIFRASKELFYIPLSFDARYRAKQVIDVFGYRFGEAIASFGITIIHNFGYSFKSLYVAIVLSASISWILVLLPTLSSFKLSKQAPNCVS